VDRRLPRLPRRHRRLAHAPARLLPRLRHDLPLEYPSADEIPRIVELLQAPTREERHWHWHTGETLDDLAAENETLETEPAGVVAADEIVRVLGKRAYAKLQAEGLL
jgi:hypothetical protein